MLAMQCTIRDIIFHVLYTVYNKSVCISLHVLFYFQGTQYFHECLYDAVKKVQDMHIKVNYLIFILTSLL